MIGILEALHELSQLSLYVDHPIEDQMCQYHKRFLPNY